MSFLTWYYQLSSKISFVHQMRGFSQESPSDVAPFQHDVLLKVQGTAVRGAVKDLVKNNPVRYRLPQSFPIGRNRTQLKTSCSGKNMSLGIMTSFAVTRGYIHQYPTIYPLYSHYKPLLTTINHYTFTIPKFSFTRSGAQRPQSQCSAPWWWDPSPRAGLENLNLCVPSGKEFAKPL